MVTLIALGEARESRDAASTFALVLLASVGALTMVKGADLLVIFLGWLTAQVAVSLAIGPRSGGRGTAPALMYFLLSSLAAGFFLYGIAFLYGATGSTNIEDISFVLEKLDLGTHGQVLAGRGLIFSGLGFSLALVPFHSWVADVYDDASPAVAAFLTVAVKAATVAGFMRIFCGFAVGRDESGLFWIVAVLTMTVGNLAALAQTSIRRLLAFSAVAHTGYLLVGIVAGGVAGWSAVFLYLITYACMFLGAFSVAARCGRTNGADDGCAGLALRFPVAGLMLALFLLSIAGVPLLGGFTGKLLVLRAAMNAGYPWLVIIGLGNGLLSLYCCLRFIAVLYRDSSGPDPVMRCSVPGSLVTGLMAAGTIHSGLFASSYAAWAQAAVERLF